MPASSRFSFIYFIVVRFLLFLTGFAAVTSCHAQSEKSVQEKMKEKYFLLGLVGYNYTDRHIDSYSINGADGGFVRLSSSTSGGSGTTCCVKLLKKYASPIKVTVRWQVDGCVYLIKDDRTGKADKVIHSYFKETEVDVERGENDSPAYFETHFFPDGSVQVAASTFPSAPRLELDKRRPDNSSYPRCKDDEKPEE